MGLGARRQRWGRARGAGAGRVYKVLSLLLGKGNREGWGEREKVRGGWRGERDAKSL